MEAKTHLDYSQFKFNADSLTKHLGSDTQNKTMETQELDQVSLNAGKDSVNSESERSDNDPVLLDSDQESQSQEQLRTGQ